MGRGLSELQKAVLRHAAERGGVCRAVLLSEAFGWKRAKGRAVSGDGKNFRPRSIGEATYRSANASLSRSLRRLVDRGLLQNNGRLPTEKGRELVRSWGVEPAIAEPPGASLEELAGQINAIVGKAIG